MTILVAALVLVAAVSLLNLVLVLAMARRLRQYADLFDGLRPADVGGSTKPAGSVVAPFTAVSVDGTQIDERWFVAPTLVAFLSPGCRPCAELLPSVVAATTRWRTLAVIEPGDEAAEQEYVSVLADAATVLTGEQARAAAAAFGVRGYPAVCVVDANRVVSATGTHLLTVPDPVGV